MAAASLRFWGEPAAPDRGGRRVSLYPQQASKSQAVFARALTKVGQERSRAYYTGADGDYCGIDFSATTRPMADIPGKTIGIYNDIVGFTTAGVLFTGAGSFADARARRIAAKRKGDHARAFKERINEVGMAGLTGAGACFLAFRPLGIVAGLKGQAVSPTAAEPLGRVAYGVAQTGNVCFGVFYAVNVKNALTALFKEMVFRFKLWTRGAQFLQEQLAPVEIKEDREAFIKQAKKDGARWLERALDEMKEAGVLPKDYKVSKEERKAIFARIMGGDDKLAAFGKQIMQRNAEENHEADLRNIVGKKCLKVLRDDATSVEDKIARIHQKFNLMHTLKAIGNFFLGVIGLLWVVYSFINDPVSNISFGLQSGVGFMIDVKKFIKWCKEGVVGKWDKIITASLMVLMAVSIGLMIAFPPLLAIPFGMAIAMMVTQGVWFAFSAVKLYFILKKEREEVSLEGLVRLIKSHASEEKVQEIYKKLPEKDRTDLRKACDQYRATMAVRILDRDPNKYDLLSGAEYLIARRKAEKQQILSELRTLVLPHIGRRAYAHG